MPQALLFPDPRPLVERLGRDFFRRLPASPGVYLMRGAADTLLYVGKAKNLRKRLGSYRVANPDRMPRRHLRMLRMVERIELQECPDEPSALAKESELLQALKPKFNRAGTWPSTPKFLAWKLTELGLHLSVTATLEEGWRSHGPVRAGAGRLRGAVVRLLWFALFPDQGSSQMPAGWFRGSYGETVTFRRRAEDAAKRLERLLTGEPRDFMESVLAQIPPDLPLFDKAILQADLEFLNENLQLGFALQSGFGQVEVPLDAAQNVVVDDAFVAQVKDGLAFLAENLL